MSFLGDDYLLPALFAFAGIALLFALAHGHAGVRHARARRHLRATYRFAWTLLFVALALIGGGAGFALRGYRLLVQETSVATIAAQQLSPQTYSVRADFPDRTHADATLHGDEWQLDARVVKWTPAAVRLGAEPLYRVDRLSGRYRDATQAQVQPPSLVDLGGDSIVDLWQLKRRFPQWLPWIDADYGSAAYLPLVDGGRYAVTISPLGGLVARPADETTAQKLKAMGW
jgi:hypothetical protein